MTDHESSQQNPENAQNRAKNTAKKTPNEGFIGFSALFQGLYASSSRPTWSRDPAPRTIIAGSLLVLAALVIICAGIKAAQTIVGPFCLAVFLTVILTVPLRWLKSKGISDFVAAFVICAGVFVAGMSITWILAGSVDRFMARMPEYTVKFNQTLSTIDEYLKPHGFSLRGGTEPERTESESASANPVPATTDDRALDSSKEAVSENLIQEKPGIFDPHSESTTASVTVSDPTQEPTETLGSPLPLNDEVESDEKVSEYENTSFFENDDEENPFSAAQHQAGTNTVGIVGYLQWGTKELTRLATMTFIVMIFVVFMMFETSCLPAKLSLPAKLTGAFGKTIAASDHLQNIIDKIWKYMLIKSIISFIVGFLVWLLLIFTHVDYAALWALIAFFLNFIPNIGSIIAAIPGVALALFDGGFTTFIIVAVGYLIINQGMGYYVEPVFLGDGLGISPLVVLLAMVFWGWLLGMIGMFLSAPLTIVLKIIFDSNEETRWISILMDNKYKETVQK